MLIKRYKNNPFLQIVKNIKREKLWKKNLFVKFVEKHHLQK